MTEDEKARLTSLRLPEDAEEQKIRSVQNSSTSGGLRNDPSQNINWATLGKISKVKNQGSCGSCWAFAATSVQEAMQAIKYNTTPVQLSEQEAVDCVTDSHGCGGGWMDHYWKYTKLNGARAYDDYHPYNARDNMCRTSSNDPIASRSERSGYVDVSQMASKLQEGPMTIALAANTPCWMHYKSGILTK